MVVKCLKTPNFSRSTFENFQKRKFPFWEFPTVINLLKTPIFQEAISKNFLFWKILTVVKSEKGPKKSEKFQKKLKNYSKIPTLTRKGRKCRKCVGNLWKIVGKLWNKFPKIPEYSKKILKNIRKIPTLIIKDRKWKNSEKCQNKFQKMHKNSEKLKASLTWCDLVWHD